MKIKSVLLSLILSISALFSSGTIGLTMAAQIGSEIFCQLQGSAFLAQSISPNQLYSCHMPGSKVSSGEILVLDIVVTGSLKLDSVVSPSFCTQTERAGIGLTVECTNDSKNSPIEDVNLDMLVSSLAGTDGSIVVSGHLKNDPTTIATTKFTAVFAPEVKNAAPEVTTQVETTTSSTVVTPPTEVSSEDRTMLMTYLALIILALLGIIIGCYYAFRTPPVTDSTVTVSVPNQPDVQPTTVQVTSPENDTTIVSVTTPKSPSDHQTGV